MYNIERNTGVFVNEEGNLVRLVRTKKKPSLLKRALEKITSYSYVDWFFMVTFLVVSYCTITAALNAIFIQ